MGHRRRPALRLDRLSEPARPAGPRTDATARRRAVALAGHAGDVAAARAGLLDGEGAVRATALGALARLGQLEPADVVAAAGDPEPAVRARAGELAAVAAGATAGGAAVDAAVALLDDPVAAVVEAACFGLGELGPAAAGGPAVAALDRVARDHGDPLCREAAVAALGAVGDDAALDAVLSAMADKPAVRRRAVLALAAFEGPQVDAALERALTDRDWQVRQAAEDLTGRQQGGD